MCGVCNGKGKVITTVIMGAYEIKACPICKPKNKVRLDKEMELFNKRLNAAIAKHEEAKSRVGVYSA